MDRIIEMLQDIEKLVLVLTNITLAIYSMVSTIRMKKWKQTANFIASSLVKEEEKTIKEPKTKDKLVFASPKRLKSYIQQVKI